MSRYLTSIGEPLALVVERTASVQLGQFAGYCANLDFWVSECEHFVLVSNSYHERLRAMKIASDDYASKYGGGFNCDDCSIPHQAVAKTTTDGERQRLVNRVRSAFRVMLRRAYDEGHIDLDRHDSYLDRIELC